MNTPKKVVRAVYDNATTIEIVGFNGKKIKPRKLSILVLMKARDQGHTSANLRVIVDDAAGYPDNCTERFPDFTIDELLADVDDRVAHLYNWKAEAQNENGRDVTAYCGHVAKSDRPFLTGKGKAAAVKRATKCKTCLRISKRRSA